MMMMLMVVVSMMMVSIKTAQPVALHLGRDDEGNLHQGDHYANYDGCQQLILVLNMINPDSNTHKGPDPDQGPDPI